MKEEHVFKKYSIGEPSLRLYLKNLAKQVEEKVCDHWTIFVTFMQHIELFDFLQDLRYIYGRYINWSDEEEINMWG